MKLFASCDTKYLNSHAPALIASAAYHHNPIHINVCGAADGDRDLLDHLCSQFSKIAGDSVGDMTWSMSTPMIYDAKAIDAQRTAYACDRFIIAPIIMEQHKEDLLIIDTDCLIMNHIEPIRNDQVGWFLRPSLPGVQGWEIAGTRVAAGAVFVSCDALPFLHSVSARIKKGPMKWFLDQVALNEAYQAHVSEYRFRYFDEHFMDWEFLQGTTIWTGKGDRKYENSTYLTKKNEFDRMIR